MQYLELNEKKKHGTDLFPFEYYFVQKGHPRYQMNYHWHTEYELIRVLDGTLMMTLNEKSFPVKKGELIFVHGGVLHAGIPDECVYECLVFDLNIFLRFAACQPYIQRVLDRSALVYHHFTAHHPKTLDIADKIFYAMHQQSEGYEMAVIGQIYQFFAHIFSAKLYLDTQPHTSARDVKKIMQLRAAIDYISQHLGTPVTLTQMAEAASMSPKYFCRFFFRMTHHTPIEYLNMQRIEYACYALSTTDEPITTIALSCGFNDLSYFIRTFRKYKGTTPGQYRG